MPPEHARRGVGTLILEHCEEAARSFGFARVELMATLTGLKPYARHGYEPGTPVQHALGHGLRIEFVPMSRRLRAGPP